jgi:hypothetical protein
MVLDLFLIVLDSHFEQFEIYLLTNKPQIVQNVKPKQLKINPKPSKRRLKRLQHSSAKPVVSYNSISFCWEDISDSEKYFFDLFGELF